MDTKRIEGLEFHVESQDYFGTLATVLSLNLELAEKMEDKSIATLKPVVEGIISDLMYLQENYKLVIK